MSLAEYYSGCAVPKPGKKQKAVRRLGDGREICKSPADWDARRAKVCEREKERCQDCGCIAPLHNSYDRNGELVPAGHAHHKRRRGMGGGKRDDRAKNLRWLCNTCHAEQHEAERREALERAREKRKEAIGAGKP